MIGLSNKNTLEALKLKSNAENKNKLCIENELNGLRNNESCINSELITTKAETEFLSGRLEIIMTQTSQVRHQISLIEICKASEECKIEAHLGNLSRHEKSFEQLFDKERKLLDQRKTELRLKEAVEQDEKKEKEKRLSEINEQIAREAASIECECEVIEIQCAVLKKRNNAMMLKLRKKLVETENIRREIRKKNINLTSQI